MKQLSKNRAELLRLFLTNPERSFYMQEIGRILGKKPGVFQRTLNNMHQEGILLSENKTHARYFRANKQYPLYSELKSIVLKTVGAAGSLRQLLANTGGIDYAFIYGSFAKNKENDLSDIDLAVVGTPDENILIKGLDRIENALKREVNYNLYAPADFRKALKKKNSFLMEILRDKKIMLIGDENALRKVSQG
jgi:predicted nucleotidyltransferase